MAPREGFRPSPLAFLEPPDLESGRADLKERIPCVHMSCPAC